MWFRKSDLRGICRSLAWLKVSSITAIGTSFGVLTLVSNEQTLDTKILLTLFIFLCVGIAIVTILSLGYSAYPKEYNDYLEVLHCSGIWGIFLDLFFILVLLSNSIKGAAEVFLVSCIACALNIILILLIHIVGYHIKVFTYETKKHCSKNRKVVIH